MISLGVAELFDMALKTGFSTKNSGGKDTGGKKGGFFSIFKKK
jgi:hypothetical protein